MLPELHMLPDDTTVGPGRHCHRVRELALQKVIESTAIARINRAARAVTSPPGEILNYKPGELVDFHRPSSTKDVSGWHGPATVVKNLPQQGQVVIRWKREEMLCRYPDVRRFMDFNGLVYGMTKSPGNPITAAFNVINDHLNMLPRKQVATLGLTPTEEGWRPTATSK